MTDEERNAIYTEGLKAGFEVAHEEYRMKLEQWSKERDDELQYLKNMHTSWRAEIARLWQAARAVQAQPEPNERLN